MIGRNGERRSGISAQTARHDDDDEESRIFLKNRGCDTYLGGDLRPGLNLPNVLLKCTPRHSDGKSNPIVSFL